MRKTHREIYEEVLNRRDRYEKVRKKRKKIAIACGSALMAIIVSIAPIYIFLSSINSGFGNNFNPGASVDINQGATSENGGDINNSDDLVQPENPNLPQEPGEVDSAGGGESGEQEESVYSTLTVQISTSENTQDLITQDDNSILSVVEYLENVSKYGGVRKEQSNGNNDFDNQTNVDLQYHDYLIFVTYKTGEQSYYIVTKDYLKFGRKYIVYISTNEYEGFQNIISQMA